MSQDPTFEQQQADAAASEAAHVGGDPGELDYGDPVDRAVIEAGGGESEGFELAERELIEHASHGDQQSAHAILHHQGVPEEAAAEGEDAGGDREHSSEREDDPEDADRQ